MTKTHVVKVEELTSRQLDELGDAADLAIKDGGGFGWLQPPPRQIQEVYWRGVLLVPERTLFLGLLDGVVAGSVQLVRPTRQNEAGATRCTLQTFFVAPWARGHGLARALVAAVEEEGRGEGFEVMNLDVRESQEAAIQLYESFGYECWGVEPLYAKVDGRWISGRHYTKLLNDVGEA